MLHWSSRFGLHPPRVGWAAAQALLVLSILLARGWGGSPPAAAPPPPAYVHVKVAPHIADPVAWVGRRVAGRVDRLFTRRGASLASPALGRWVRVETSAEPQLLAIALADLPEIVAAFPAPEVALPLAEARPAPASSCPVRTPSFEPYQGYLGPAPGGIDAPAAWRAGRGGRGEDVWFADLEFGWNPGHEDLPGERIEHIVGKPTGPWSHDHGTAVLGEVVGRDNQLGVTGIAPETARVFTASIVGLSVADAIERAQARLRAGDVLLIELHAIGPRRRFLPVEYWDDIFEAIQVASGRGVIVVEAAGNGAEDLDHPDYRGKLSRRGRDSGAILVGAGAPLGAGFVDRSRLDFSNYGSRVDVQGWGRRVTTLHYGDLQACGVEDRDLPRDRDYTAAFGGTSSASPIVAGAAVVLQGLARARRGRPLTPAELRELLRATGSPQTDGPDGPVSQQIGPRPDLALAIQKL